MPSPGLPGGECQTQSETCQLDESVIAIKQSVQTIGQCRQYCREKDGCTHFTLFGREEFELVNTCVLFSSCFSTNPCTDCISEDTTRPCHLCSSPVVEGNIGANNLLEFLPNIAEELDCWAACRQVSECMFYSHHTSLHPSFPSTCFLLSHLEGEIRPCENCATGSWDCEPKNTCKLLHSNGTAADSSYIILTNSAVVKTLVLGSTTTCSLSILAVGGGGHGSCSTGGGGGSGFVEMTTINVENMDELVVNVGGANLTSSTASSVEIQGVEVIVAQPGDEGESFLNTTDTSRSTPCSGPSGAGAGGRGFSGGGGYGGDHGGSGGSDGRDGSDGSDRSDAYGKGGNGSGTSLEDFNLPQFTLR